jgi:hypothetical protein
VDRQLELARELLVDVGLLLAEGRYRSTVSRAYYASDHACVVLMGRLGLRPNNFIGRGGRPAGRWEHGIVTARVAADPRLRRVLGEPVALQVRWQYSQRIKGDYRAQDPVSDLAARTSAMLAEQVVRSVEGYLDAQNS